MSPKRSPCRASVAESFEVLMVCACTVLVTARCAKRIALVTLLPSRTLAAVSPLPPLPTAILVLVPLRLLAAGCVRTASAPSCTRAACRGTSLLAARPLLKPLCLVPRPTLFLRTRWPSLWGAAFSPHSMFGAVPQKREAPAAAGGDTAMVVAAEAAPSSSQGQLLRALAKLTLQLEGERRSHARDDNFVVQYAQGGPLDEALKYTVQQYEETGRKAREGEGFMGHPEGKRPDALFRGLLFRLQQQVAAKPEAFNNGFTSSTEPVRTEILGALGVLKLWGDMAGSEKGKEIRATRCFNLAANAEGKVKWVFAIKQHEVLERAFSCLREHMVLEAIEVDLLVDHAPQSKAAKEVQKLAFTDSGGPRARGRGGGQQKKAKH